MASTKCEIMVRARYTEPAPTEDDPNAVNKVTEVVQLHKQYDGKPSFMKVYMANFQKFIREGGFLVQGYEWLAYPNEVASMLINYDANWVKKYWNSQVEDGADPRDINPRPDIRVRPWGQMVGDMDYVYIIDLPEVSLTTSPPIYINIKGFQAGKEASRILTKIREGKEPPSKPDMFISLTLVDKNDVAEGLTVEPTEAMLADYKPVTSVEEPSQGGELKAMTWKDVLGNIAEQNAGKAAPEGEGGQVEASVLTKDEMLAQGLTKEQLKALGPNFTAIGFKATKKK